MNTHDNADEKGIELASLLAGIVVVDPIWDRKINGVTLDSRKVQAGDLFIACLGQQQDGRQYIKDAVAKGAIAVIAEEEQADTHINSMEENSVPIFYAAQLNHKIGVIASRFYHHPSRRLHVIGVTGTNGKTSCSHYLAEALHTPKEPCAIIGTVGYGVCDQLQTAGLTTPDAVDMQALLADFEAQGIQTVTMEASSHALDQDRVKHVEIKTAIFTNLSRDHLDYHGSLEAYGAAKLKLFEKFGLRHAIINCDDPFSKKILAVVPATVKVLTYSVDNPQADVYFTKLTLDVNGIKANVVTPWGKGVLESQLLGRFNASNLLAVLTSLGTMNISLENAITRLKTIRGVVGRMQRYQADDTATVVIDYAHTPDALEKALQALREHTKGKLWCIFGCGGNRDQGKRPLMGKVALTHADHIILTDDNPRFEKPQVIINDILSGITDKKQIQVEHDRQRALALALEQADADDCILLAGKGHEAYQQIGDKRVEISDQHIVESLLKTGSLSVSVTNE